jgi:nucleotide-binding universal stress UspA family protein
VKRILVPLDGSRLSDAIIPLAEVLARDYEAAILLLRALPTPNSPEAQSKAEQEASTYLASIAAHLEARGVRVEWKVWYDEPGRAIVDAARSNDVDLIAMTTHGRGGLGRLLLGSVAETVVRTAAVPVLLVRGELSWRPGNLGTIVVALDGSDLAEAILSVVARLAGPLDLSLELVRAIEPLPAYAAPELATNRAREIIEQQAADARSYLATVAAGLEGKGLRVSTSIHLGLAVDVILRHAQTTGAGLIAMTTHGRTGVGRLLLGSVSEAVLRAAPVPVLLWKAPAERRAD